MLLMVVENFIIVMFFQTFHDISVYIYGEEILTCFHLYDSDWLQHRTGTWQNATDPCIYHECENGSVSTTNITDTCTCPEVSVPFFSIPFSAFSTFPD